jgi:hypothetical protein
MSATGFHKDTLGKTLFVNLNYHMDKPGLGPEFVVNPPPSQTHDELTQTTLPPGFRDDLALTRQALGAPTEYGAGIANPYDYVAFVDEAIHHATPFYHHRYVTGADLDQYLTTNHPAEMQEAKRAWGLYKKSFWPSAIYPLASYFDEKIIPKSSAAKWEVLMELVADAKRHITRNDLKDAITNKEFDEALEISGAKGASARRGRPPASTRPRSQKLPWSRSTRNGHR